MSWVGFKRTWIELGLIEFGLRAPGFKSVGVIWVSWLGNNLGLLVWK